MPEAFGFKDLKKDFFPHKFNHKANWTYSDPYPAAEFYSPNYMSRKERAEFLSWHQDKVERGEHFDFKKEILEYYRNDVDILRNACLKFRDIILSLTGKQVVFYNEVAGAPDKRTEGGVDPFSQITIASVCMKIFKTKFLHENCEVTVKKTDVTDWLPAIYKDGNLSVLTDADYISCDELQ